MADNDLGADETHPIDLEVVTVYHGAFRNVTSGVHVTLEKPTSSA